MIQAVVHPSVPAEWESRETLMAMRAQSTPA
jgi:hypothetical protein